MPNSLLDWLDWDRLRNRKETSSRKSRFLRPKPFLFTAPQLASRLFRTAVTHRGSVACAILRPPSLITVTRSRKLSLKLKYQRTHRMTYWPKCRLLNSSSTGRNRDICLSFPNTIGVCTRAIESSFGIHIWPIKLLKFSQLQQSVLPPTRMGANISPLRQPNIGSSLFQPAKPRDNIAACFTSAPFASGSQSFQSLFAAPLRTHKSARPACREP